MASGRRTTSVALQVQSTTFALDTARLRLVERSAGDRATASLAGAAFRSGIRAGRPTRHCLGQLTLDFARHSCAILFSKGTCGSCRNGDMSYAISTATRRLHHGAQMRIRLASRFACFDSSKLIVTERFCSDALEPIRRGSIRSCIR